ncbi:DUF3667 domain-containing protein [Flavobacterium sp.]|uniref:DUF3667 domain-containing protein n=1 Tax=Flavobacterium sp. TaxID=239 RepID=UPI0037530A64
MSKNTIRKDKTCLNCSYVVENRFCSNCGQENIDTRKSFHQLFVHFFEDLTHYENSFWRTIKNLIFKPASLTKEYLSGKRMSYLAPIRLYIFISFVTFFLIAVLPSDDDKKNDLVQINTDDKKTKSENDTVYKEQQKILEFEKQGLISKKESDSLQKFIIEAKKKNEDDSFMNLGKHYKNVKELDSIQEHAKSSDKLGSFQYWLKRKSQLINDKMTKEEIQEKFIESYFKNLPKALFFYMPLFAFVLWIFQNKKRWYYFDHGIFTLHYFSFLLLGSLFISFIDFLISFVNNYSFFNVLNYIFKIVTVVYMLYYFFPAHHRFYEEKRWMSILKGIVMFFINFFIIGIILTCFAVYTFINLH